MTNILNLLKVELNQALSNEDYDSVFDLFTVNKISFTEFFIFHKKNEKILTRSKFWNSKLPHFYLNNIIQSDLKVNFLKSYFSSEFNCNKELNSHLLLIAREDFIQHFKLWKAFTKNSFFESLTNVSNCDTELQRIVKEFEIARKVIDRIQKEEQQDKQFSIQFNLDEILMGFTLYHYALKQSPQTTGDKNWQTMIEMAVVDELNKVLRYIQEANKITIEYASNDEVQREFRLYEAPHHILGKKGIIVPLSDKYKLIYELINKAIQRKSELGIIDTYISGFSDFKSVNLNLAILETNESYRIFQINNAKSQPESLYLTGLDLEKIHFGENSFLKSVRTNPEGLLKLMKSCGYSENINVSNKDINLSKVFKLLLFFSVYKGTTERNFYPDKSFDIMNQGDNDFLKLFGTNESISLFDYDKLINSVSEYFKWSYSETESIMEFLTLDMNSKSFPNYWVSRPFIKTGNKAFWLGSLLKDRRWDNILLNRFKKDFEFKNQVNQVSASFEKSVGDVFKKGDFKTIVSQKYKSSNGQSGDFDVLAFKDNFLFVCEVKSGVRSDDFFHSVFSEKVRLEGCAVEQLNKGIKNVKEDWASIKDKMGIDSDIDIENVSIVPLIITDYFEGDLKLYKDIIRKISLLELEVLLQNRKRELLQAYMISQRFINSDNHDLKDEITMPKNWDLWDGGKNPKPEKIIENIDNNSIWKEVEAIWKFKPSKDLLNY